MLSISIGTTLSTHVTSLSTIGRRQASALSESLVSAHQGMHRKNMEIDECIVMGNLHFSEPAISQAQLRQYHQGLRDRLNKEYCPRHETVFLLGTPQVTENQGQLSLPVSPSLLAEKLLEVAGARVEKEQRDVHAQRNGYVLTQHMS